VGKKVWKKDDLAGRGHDRLALIIGCRLHHNPAAAARAEDGENWRKWRVSVGHDRI
jgi:hypothetical protein